VGEVDSLQSLQVAMPAARALKGQTVRNAKKPNVFWETVRNVPLSGLKKVIVFNRLLHVVAAV